MLSFKQYLKARSSPSATKILLKEGIELRASDLIKELTAMRAKSIFAKVITENADEVTLHLQVKK
jgi:hypothetical protein